MRILEEFWYGNIEPTEYDTFPCAEYKEALQLITHSLNNGNKEKCNILSEREFGI